MFVFGMDKKNVEHLTVGKASWRYVFHLHCREEKLSSDTWLSKLFQNFINGSGSYMLIMQLN